jgi:DNA-binding transcriptional MerR regulator
LPLTLKEIAETIHISQAELLKWVEAGLIIPEIGFKNSFLPEALEDARLIQKFVELGYTLKEIKKIKKKVGLPYKNLPTEILLSNNLLTIGELALKSGLNTRTIKFWEEKGLIQPCSRTDGGFRLYKKEDIRFLNLIKDLQTFNYTLSEIGEILHLVKDEFNIPDDSKELSQLLPFIVDNEKLKKEQANLEYLLERMKEVREATFRAEAIFNKALKRVSKKLKAD